MKNWLLKLVGVLGQTHSKRVVRNILYIFFAVCVVVITTILSLPHLMQEITLKTDDIASDDIILNQNIRYIDHEQLKTFQRQASEREKLIFDRDFNSFRKLAENLNLEMALLFQALRSSQQVPDDLQKLYSFDWATLKESKLTYENLLQRAIDIHRYVFIHFAFLKNNLQPWQTNSIRSNSAVVRNINYTKDKEHLWVDEENTLTLEQVMVAEANSLNKIFQVVADFSYKNGHGIDRQNVFEVALLKRMIAFYISQPSTEFNSHETNFRRQKSMGELKIPYKELQRNSIIVKRGQSVSQEIYDKIKIVNQHLWANNFKKIGGILLLQIILAVAFVFYLYRYCLDTLRDTASMVILISQTVFFLILSVVVTRLNLFSNYFALFLPIGYTALMLAYQLGPRITLSMGIYLAINLYFITENDYASFVIAFCNFMAAIFIYEKITKRTKLIFSAFYLFLYSAVAVIGFDLIQNASFEQSMIKLLLTFIISVISAVLLIATFPVYELMFNMATPFRLLELSDTDHPLLNKMATSAPSTYAHSMMVANLSERAVSAIGGDALLTKVGCLFHDIGKMSNPSFFAENKHLFPTSEQYKKLGPLKSAQIIINHVIEGIVIARQYRLPEKVISFIPEHHGTTTIQYFYHKKLEEQSGRSGTKTKIQPVDKKQFSYLGPKPQSKETAVVMIADSLEAAARSMAELDKQKLSELIEVIIQNKLDENQFSDCPLSLAELDKVKKAFLEVLMSYYHLRPEYPKMKDTIHLEQSLEAKADTGAATNKAIKKTKIIL